MKRADAALQFTIDSGGYIATPGPFYGERFFVPHFWDKAKSPVRRVTMQDGHGMSWQFFPVTAADRREYPELKEVEKVGVRRDQDGNVLSWVCAFGFVPIRARHG